MKPFISSVLVVEGTNDASYISSMYDVEIVVLNGYDCPSEELDYLKEVSKFKKVLLLTDPDEAGKTIRNRLHETGIEFIDLHVDLSKCSKNGKHGVAECEKEEIYRVFAPYLVQKPTILNEIKVSKIYELVPSKAQREKLSEKLHLGKCNMKKFVQRINSLGITLEQLKKEITSVN